MPREDTFLLKDSIVNFLNKNNHLIDNIQNVIEIGSGTGFISYNLFKHINSMNPNVNFYLTDINLSAIKYMKKQYFDLIEKNKFKIIHSYLLNELEFIFKYNKKTRIKEKTKTKKTENGVSLILFNPPYLPESNEKYGNDISITGGKKGNEIILEFIDQLSYLKKNYKKNNLLTKTIVFLLISSLSGLKDIFLSLKNKNLNFKIISDKNFFFEKLYVLYIEF